MEDRTRRAETPQSKQHDDGRDTRTDKASDERQYESLQAELDGLRNAAMKRDNGGKSETITFENTSGNFYIWPFELCQSLDGAQSLLEEVYSRRKEEDSVTAIREGRFNFVTEEGAIILPSVWSSIVKPFSTISVRFYLPEATWGRPRSRHRVRRQSPHDANVRFREAPDRDDEDEDEWYRNITINAEEPDPPPRLPSESESDDVGGYSSDSQTPGENGDEEPEQLELVEPVREVIPPIDCEGNKLSFTVDTTRRRALPQSKTQPESHDIDLEALDAKDAPKAPVETLRITRAMSTEREGRNLVEIHVLPGPENVQLRHSVGITWLHITLERLDFTRFRNVCLAVPQLSDRLKRLTWELLGKIEKEKVNAYLDGMFIEPGTVLRADERGQLDPQSVMFSCTPYFDLQAPAKRSTTGPGYRLFPARTLMQSYYPYEPVRERDAEQAYRKFGNDRSGSMVHVPNFWIMNIGTSVVVTCGYKPLSAEMVKSIITVEDDIKLLGAHNVPEDTVTRIRLTDWDGRVLIFPLDACRSYFQLEQKVKELRYTACASGFDKTFQLHHKTPHGIETADPKNWSAIIRRTDLVFIDLAVVDGMKGKDLQKGVVTDRLTANPPAFEPPLFEPPLFEPPLFEPPRFFHWPRTTTETATKLNRTTPRPSPSYVYGPRFCLEHIERLMISQTLEDYETVNAVDKTFTSTVYYQSLPEHTYGDLCTLITSFKPSMDETKRSDPCSTHHQIIVQDQRAAISARVADFFKIVHATIALFISDTDKSSILRKVWGAMTHIYKRIVAIQQREAQSPDFVDAWSIRNPTRDSNLPSSLPPDADANFARSVRHCRKCRSVKAFDSQAAALEHLRQHVKITSQELHNASPDTDQPVQGLSSDSHLKDWTMSVGQRSCEETNEGALKILTMACETGKDLFIQAKELSQGVQNENGSISELYKLPHQLIEAFRNICVFYMATERALFYTEETFKTFASGPGQRFDDELPYSKVGLDVLKRFGDSARRSLVMSRHELCWQMRSDPPLDVFRHLSLGPEYVCAWLMRRLLVQPLEKRMTVGDMYREYVSTIQFQVNHRPGKRLLRAINLLQEELQILLSVNTSQTNLIQNYMRVLDDSSYEKDIPSRRSMFTYERTLLNTCLDNLELAREEYTDLLRRCGPLAANTKQSLEINEEDHGKAIMVFTIVTVIFLPLSFVTSFFGMNTADLRDMDSRQGLFWSVAIPLTVLTVGSCLLIGYNGDELRDTVSSLYRAVTGKQDRGGSARGISVAQRKRAQRDSNSTPETSSLADEAEFASPRPEYGQTFLSPYAGKDYDTRLVETRRAQTQTYAGHFPLDEEIVIRERNHFGPYERGDRNPFHTQASTRVRYCGGPPSPPPPRPPPRVRRYEVEDEQGEGYTWHRKGRGSGRHVGRRVVERPGEYEEYER